jgi:hypothetical protein
MTLWKGQMTQSSPDIVERMKNYIHGEHDDYIPEVLQLACAEIERLRAQAASPPDQHYRAMLRQIGEIVRTPTKATRHRTARDHFQSDFDAIRKIVASSDRGGESRPALSSTLAPQASAVADVVVHPAGVATGLSEDLQIKLLDALVHKLFTRQEALEAALRKIDAINDGPWFNECIYDVCRVALAPEQDKCS